MVTLNEQEAAIVKAALEFVADSPIGFEAIYGWVDEDIVEEDEIWDLAQELEEKL